MCEITAHAHVEKCFDSPETTETETTETETTETETTEAETTDPETAEPETAGKVFTYQSDAVSVTVTLPDTSAVPEDAALRVEPIARENSQYPELVNQAAQVMDSSLAFIQLFDISFYTPDGEYYPVDEAAAVTIHIPEALQGDFTVLHYPSTAPEQEAPVEPEPAAEATEADTAADDSGIMPMSGMEGEEAEAFSMFSALSEPQGPVAVEDLQIQQDDSGMTLTFTTDGFSVYAVVQVGTGKDIFTVTDENVTDLHNQGPFLILEDEGVYGLTKDGSSDSACRAITAVVGDMDEWTFEKNESGYRIRTGTNTYLRLNNKTLTTSNRNSATTFTVTVAEGGYIRLSANGMSIDHYGTAGFGGWDDTSANNQRFYLAKRDTGESVTVADLDGKKFAIVNTNTSSRTWAMTDTITNNGSATGLEGVPIEVVRGDDGSYIVYDSGDLTVWTFTSTGSGNGGYYISSGGKYLNLNGTNNVTVSTTPQAIYVTTKASYPGQVKLYNANTVVDWFGANINNNMFSGWSGDGGNNYQTLAQVVPSVDILYNLNEPSHIGDWVSGYDVALSGNVLDDIDTMTQLSDKPTGSVSELGPAGMAWAEQNPGADVADNPYSGLYRMESNIPTTVIHNNLQLLQGLGCGYKEWRFDGWQYTDSDGIVYLLAPGTTVTTKSTNSITVTPVAVISEDDSFIPYTGEPITIPAGTTLHGHWTEVSAPVYFFINYTGTILDTEGDVTGRSTSNFMNGAAVGRVYYGRTTVGSDGSYANAAHQQISSLFTDVAHLDLDSRETQLVINAATNYDGTLTNVSGNTEHDETFAEANSRIIMEAVLAWIREDSRLTIKLSTGNGQTKVNNDLATTDNYNVRWYVLKEQGDGWHIDGVVTAVTKTLTVTKSFEGLSPEQAKAVLADYTIDMWIRNNTSDQKYMILRDLSQLTEDEKNDLMGQFEDYGNYQEVNGQYTFRYDEASQTAQWTVRILSQEHVTLREANYALDDYIVNAYSTIDGRPVSLSSDTIGYDVSEAENDPSKDVVGGVNKEVAFSNIYTQVGKGSFSLLKQNAPTGSVMQNVEFTLTNENGETVLTERTDATGWVHFLNLDPGIYTVTEATPTGFLPNGELTVVVSRDDNNTVTVTVQDAEGNLLAQGSPVAQHTLENKPADSTVILEKVFENITREEIEDMTDYAITVSEDGTQLHKLLLADADYTSPDGLRYNWVLTGLDNKTLDITEHHFSSIAHIDVQVTGQITSGGETTTLNVVTDRTNTHATTQVTTGSTTARITVTNNYTDEFELFLQKVDTITQEPLQGVVFELYGTYEESTNTRKTIRYYMDADHSQVGTLYYIGQTEASDANGLARVTGLKLSQEGKTYAYVLSEVHAPDGYVLPQYEIVPFEQVVIVTLQDLTNNVFSTSMVNQVKGEDLKVVKETALSGEFPITITISAPEPTVRYANRQYTYRIYDSTGSPDEPVAVTGTAEYNQAGAANLVANVDSVTFTVELKAGEYVVVENVPVNYLYEVQEQDGGYYTSMANANGTGAYYATQRKMEGSILADAENTVTVSNYDDPDDATTTVKVTKHWVGAPEGESVKPDVTIRLYTTDGTLEGTAVLDDSNNWTYTWSNLPLYNSTGQAQDYYIREDLVAGYTASYDRPFTNLGAHATAAHPVVTNTLGSPALPNTGGSGTQNLILAGIVLMSLSAFIGYTKYKRERRRT